MEVDPQAEPLTCPGCQTAVDQHGDHLLCCRRNNYTNRHSAVQEALAAMLVEAGQPFGREVMIPEYAENLRPADLLLKSWLAGTDVAVNLTVSHGINSHICHKRKRWRGFLTRKERTKKEKYILPCQQAGWAFLPMAFGTWGGMGPEAGAGQSSCVAGRQLADKEAGGAPADSGSGPDGSHLETAGCSQLDPIVPPRGGTDNRTWPVVPPCTPVAPLCPYVECTSPWTPQKAQQHPPPRLANQNRRTRTLPRW